MLGQFGDRARVKYTGGFVGNIYTYIHTYIHTHIYIYIYTHKTNVLKRYKREKEHSVIPKHLTT